MPPVVAQVPSLPQPLPTHYPTDSYIHSVSTYFFLSVHLVREPYHPHPLHPWLRRASPLGLPHATMSMAPVARALVRGGGAARGPARGYPKGRRVSLRPVLDTHARWGADTSFAVSGVIIFGVVRPPFPFPVPFPVPYSSPVPFSSIFQIHLPVRPLPASSSSGSSFSSSGQIV